jgi:hypothetical protein
MCVLVPGVQIAYLATIGTQLFMVVLSIVLLFGIFKVQDIHRVVSSERGLEEAWGVQTGRCQALT